MQRFSCNLHSQDEFGSLLLSLERWFPLSKSCWEYCTAFHLYRATGCRFNLSRHNLSEDNFKILLKISLVTHVCHCPPQNARHQEAIWGNNTVLWCHGFFQFRSPPSQGHLPSYTHWMGWNPPLSPQPWRKHMVNMALCLHQQGSCLLCGKGKDL